MRAHHDDLLDLLDEIQTTERLNGPAPSLFASTTRGVQERVAEFQAWCEEHDSFASYRRSHAWLPEISNSREARDWSAALPSRCLPTVLHANLQDCDHAGRRCYDVGGLVYRGACYGCTWESPSIRGRVSEAVEDAHDHAWPGWRDLPIVPCRPDEEYARKAGRRKVSPRQEWEDQVNGVYPADWLVAGGPIVTARSEYATGDVPGRTGRGGYDLAARPFHQEASCER